MSDFRNTSYDQEYVVVSSSGGQVVLRPRHEALLATYWKEFVSADVAVSETLLLRLTGLPAEVRRLGANEAYTLEYPKVILVQRDKETDLSYLVSANKPSAGTPGLYVIEYVLPLPGVKDNVVWKSYLSIEEPPVLRQAITPWNRDSYAIQNLTRLVLEPQFQEALYEEGAPLYNFVTANMPPALRPGGARECYQCVGYKSGDCLFVSGRRLPLSTVVEVQPAHGSSFEMHLDRNVVATEWKPSSYPAGSVVQKSRRAYCSLQAVGAEDVPGSSARWAEGGLYSLQERDSLGWVQQPSGAVQLLAVWAPVDLRGYLFAVDVQHAPALGTYWGHYDRRHFPDYRPGDIVSYVSGGVLYFYCRNDTDIRDLSSEEAYRPGSFQNPHWDEVYVEWEAGQLRKLGRWIRPLTNASNAVIAKTGSLSEEMCSVYAYIMGIPASIVDAIGSKCSVFLYILLQRTRNTFEGFRDAFRAIGLDVADLHKVYDTTPAAGEDGELFEGVYPAAEALKRISAAVHDDRLWQGEPDEVPPTLEEGKSWIRYWPDPRTADLQGSHVHSEVQEYRDGAWVTIYKLLGFGDEGGPAKGNNRYYRATLSLLDRLASQALVEMGDDKQWIDLNSLSEISHWVTDLVAYEVPMYIYIALSVQAASIDHTAMSGRGMRRVHMSAYGGTPTLVVHPTYYFDLASAELKLLQAKVLVQEESSWVEAAPTSTRDGSHVYHFDRSVTVRFQFSEGQEVIGYWTSRHTVGVLGSEEDGFVDASEAGAAQELYLANGIVGVTPLCAGSTLRGTLEYLKYNYVLTDDGEPWKLDGVTPFGGYAAAGGLQVLSSWSTPLSEFPAAVGQVTKRGGEPLSCALQEVEGKVQLEIFGESPEEIYIYGKRSQLLALVCLPGLPYKVRPEDAGELAVYRILLQEA